MVKGDIKAPFSITTTPRCWRGRNYFPWIAQLTLDPYFVMLSVKQGGVKYHSWVFGMTRAGIESRSPGALVNTLTIVLTDGPGNRVSVPGWVIPKTQKMALEASLFNTQHYKLWIKGKWNNTRKGVAHYPILRSCSYWKGSLWLPLTTCQISREFASSLGGRGSIPSCLTQH